MPGEADDLHYSIFSLSEKTVMDYAHLNLGLQRDAFIFNLQQTESGREYLEECWLLEQTEPDRKALRGKFGKGAEHGEH